MTITVKLFVFAGLRETLETKSEIVIQLPKSDWQSNEELKLFLLNFLKECWEYKRSQDCDQSTNIDRYMDPNIYLLALNECYVDEARLLTIKEMDHIALIQPVNGGW